ncbi:hypothetical protein Acr_00g0046680 [Actinidia rufa]|uniref:Uncharacterized protein n=1 Tax=Actinidia rufa TaxID=165716 RepID=A0A7J0DJZ1_9ERIC|nr:hypothetical protein Acr_00g0046680 [Actinidia rufa]
MARLLTPTVAPPVAYRSTDEGLLRVTEQRGSLSKSNRPSSVSKSSLVRSVSKQISHNHSPRRRLTVGSAFPTRSGRVSDEIGASFRRASEEEAPIRGSQGDSPPLCKIPATKRRIPHILQFRISHRRKLYLAPFDTSFLDDFF